MNCFWLEFREFRKSVFLKFPKSHYISTTTIVQSRRVVPHITKWWCNMVLHVLDMKITFFHQIFLITIIIWKYDHIICLDIYVWYNDVTCISCIHVTLSVYTMFKIHKINIIIMSLMFNDHLWSSCDMSCDMLHFHLPRLFSISKKSYLI